MLRDSDKEDNIGKKVVICDLCRKSKDSLVNSMVCNECIHQKKSISIVYLKLYL